MSEHDCTKRAVRKEDAAKIAAWYECKVCGERLG